MTGYLGRQILAEFYGCKREALEAVPFIESAMRRAAITAGATIVSSTFKQFDPWGVSGVVVIQESHLAIHTWPEHEYASVDLFTCGESVDPRKAFEFLRRELGASRVESIEQHRGLLSRINLLQRAAG